MNKPNVVLCINGPDGFEALDYWARANVAVWARATDEAMYVNLTREGRLEWICTRLLDQLEAVTGEAIRRAANEPYIVITKAKPQPETAIALREGDVREVTKPECGEGWRFLEEGEPLLPGDGYSHPQMPDFWTDYASRPDIFRGGGKEGSRYYVPKNDTAHTWPWRRRIGAVANEQD